MNSKNKVLESANTTKDILERLNDPCRLICLYDCKDNSKIVMDDELLQVVNRHYQDKYREGM